MAYALTWYVVVDSRSAMVWEKTPVPASEPVKEAQVSLVVGSAEVDQQIPHSVTVAPPSFVTSPPPVARSELMSVTLAVVTVGTVIFNVVKLRSEPFVAPAAFVPLTR